MKNKIFKINVIERDKKGYTVSAHYNEYIVVEEPYCLEPDFEYLAKLKAQKRYSTDSKNTEFDVQILEEIPFSKIKLSDIYVEDLCILLSDYFTSKETFN